MSTISDINDGKIKYTDLTIQILSLIKYQI
jgi:hypothetical protein